MIGRSSGADVSPDRIPSSGLVLLQFGLAAALMATCWPPAEGAWPAAAAIVFIAGAAVGIAALAANRPGNFSIFPEPKAGAQLVTGGIYRVIRHPMYTAFLLALLAAVLLDPLLWRIAAWLALLAVLIVKALREERLLAARFAQYADYRARTRRLLPWLY